MGHIGLLTPEAFDALFANHNILARGYLCNRKVMEGPDFNPVTPTLASHWFMVIGPKNG